MTLNVENLFFKEKLKLAKSKNMPSDVLEKLSLDNYHQIRSLIASNPNTPLVVLEAIGEKYADLAILEKLKNDPSKHFSLSATENINNSFE
ncbi:MAG: hypothetical protein AAGF83_00655 [Cyanobacteria bacterium P01_G01_bin.67]